MPEVSRGADTFGRALPSPGAPGLNDTGPKCESHNQAGNGQMCSPPGQVRVVRVCGGPWGKADICLPPKGDQSRANASAEASRGL